MWHALDTLCRLKKSNHQDLICSLFVVNVSFLLFLCADHPGPCAGARLQEQPDVEQSSWRTLRLAAVLWLPGRFPLLLCHTGSVTHTNTETDTYHELCKTYITAITLLHTWKISSSSVAPPPNVCPNFCTREEFSVDFYLAAAEDLELVWTAENMAFTPDLLPSLNGCV